MCTAWTWGANRTFSHAGSMSGCSNKCVLLLSSPLLCCSSGLLVQVLVGVSSSYPNLWQPGSPPRGAPVDENRTLSQNFQHSHHRKEVYKGRGMCIFPLYTTVQQESHPIFPPQSQCHRASLILMALSMRFQKKNPRVLWNAQLLGTRTQKHLACSEHSENTATLIRVPSGFLEGWLPWE